MAFYQKYRSQKFSDLIGEDNVRDTLLEAVKSDKLSHAYLLAGPRGTGKTSTARLLAKSLNCLTIAESRKKGKSITGEPCNTCSSCLEIMEGRSIDVIEIDAASHTGVDEVRELIEKAQFAPSKSLKKIYIIDEVHMLSKSAFNALLKTLEEPPKHIVFILATTEAYKLLPTIISRVQRYDFKRVAKDEIVKNLKKIAKAEKIEIDTASLELIALSAHGGHRDAIGLLEKVASLGGKITVAEVEDILGIAGRKEVLGFLGAIFNSSAEEGLKIAHRLYEGGIDMIQFNKDVIEELRKILIFNQSNQVLFEDTDESVEIIKNLSQKSDGASIVNLLEIFIKAGNLFKDISYPVLPVEMAIVESCEQLSTSQNHESGIKNHESNNEPEAKNHSNQRLQRTQDIKKASEEDKVKSADETEEEDKKTHNSKFLPAGRHGIIHDSTAAPVLQMTADVWDRVIQEAKKENNTLAALLRDAKPMDLTSSNLILGVKFKFHKDKISSPENVKILEKIFCDVTGNRCVINCELLAERPKTAKAMNGEELQKAAEEIFEIE